MRNMLAIAVLLALAGTAEGQSPSGRDPAAQPCFSPAEIEAEQAMQFQTELMVVAETCRDPSYIKFVERNREAVIAYQKQMMDRFRRHGATNPDRELDVYLTKLANEWAVRDGPMGVTQLCAYGARLMETGNALGNAGFRDYAAEKARLRKQHYNVCSGSTAAAD